MPFSDKLSVVESRRMVPQLITRSQYERVLKYVKVYSNVAKVSLKFAFYSDSALRHEVHCGPRIRDLMSAVQVTDTPGPQLEKQCAEPIRSHERFSFLRVKLSFQKSAF